MKNNLILQMTVVEAYVGRKKINLPDDSSQLHSLVSSLLSEGIAQNTSGNVFEPEVIFSLLVVSHNISTGGQLILFFNCWTLVAIINLFFWYLKLYYIEQGGEVEISGSPTEKAILSWAVKVRFQFALVCTFGTVFCFPIFEHYLIDQICISVRDEV